jgi:hypothetical protein
MERVYGWPVAHEVGYPDLCGGEETLGENFAYFNRTHHAGRAVLVNQWDWNQAVCGERMPNDMTFADIRRGTDLEFGLSVYEPFGISQLEPLCFGALCVGSNVCGAMGFVRRASEHVAKADNVIEGDFLRVPDDMSIDDLLKISVERRDAIEAGEGKRLAERIIELLPRDRTSMERLVGSGHDLAQRMSWQRVVKEYFLPSLRRVSRA